MGVLGGTIGYIWVPFYVMDRNICGGGKQRPFPTRVRAAIAPSVWWNAEERTSSSDTRSLPHKAVDMPLIMPIAWFPRVLRLFEGAMQLARVGLCGDVSVGEHGLRSASALPHTSLRRSAKAR